MIFIPVGSEDARIKRPPFVGAAVVVLCVAVFVTTQDDVHLANMEVWDATGEVASYYLEHPWLAPPELHGFDLRAAVVDELGDLGGGEPPQEISVIEQQQAELDALAENLASAQARHPYQRYGLIPDQPSLMAAVTSMFMHGGWLHLIGNILLFFVMGMLLEDTFGAALFATLYLVGGVVAGFTHVLFFPDSAIPLIGASGAVSAVMGAFLVRYATRHLKIWYWFFFVHGTFSAPALLLLPVWFGWEVLDAFHSTGDGIAHLAHIGGFVCGVGVGFLNRHFALESGVDVSVELGDVRPPAQKHYAAAMSALDRDDPHLAAVKLDQAAVADPRSATIADLRWDLACRSRDPADVTRVGVQLVQRSLDGRDPEAALLRWRALEERAPGTGSASLRYRLACAVKEREPGLAARLLDEVIAESQLGGALQQKAARVRQTIDVEPALSSASPDLAPASAAGLGPDLAPLGLEGDDFALDLAGDPADELAFSPLTDDAEPEIDPFGTTQPAEHLVPAEEARPEPKAADPPRDPIVAPEPAAPLLDEETELVAAGSGDRMKGFPLIPPRHPLKPHLADAQTRRTHPATRPVHAVSEPVGTLPDGPPVDFRTTGVGPVRRNTDAPGVGPPPRPRTPPPPASRPSTPPPSFFDSEAAPRTRRLGFKRCQLVAVEGDALRFGDGSRLPLGSIQAVSAALIREPGATRVLLDLVLNWRTQATKPLKIVRLDSREMDAGGLLCRTDLGPKDAVAELARTIAERSSAELVPEGLQTSAAALPRFDALAQYHEAALQRPATG